MFKESPEGQTHHTNDGCGEPAHNTMKNISEIIKSTRKELRRWWAFSDSQIPLSSWHDREDYIEKVLPELLRSAVEVALKECRPEKISIIDATKIIGNECHYEMMQGNCLSDYDQKVKEFLK